MDIKNKKLECKNLTEIITFVNYTIVTLQKNQNLKKHFNKTK